MSIHHCGSSEKRRSMHGPLPFHRGVLIERGRWRSPRARSDPARTCSPANASFECDPAWGHGHVLGEGQRTLPLLHYTVRGICVGVHTCVLTCVRTYVRACVCPTPDGGRVSAQRRIASLPWSALVIDMIPPPPRHCG